MCKICLDTVQSLKCLICLNTILYGTENVVLTWIVVQIKMAEDVYWNLIRVDQLADDLRRGFSKVDLTVLTLSLLDLFLTIFLNVRLSAAFFDSADIAQRTIVIG